MSIRWRLLLSYLLVVAVATGALAIHLGHELNRHYVQTLERALLPQTALIGDALRPALQRSTERAGLQGKVRRLAAAANARLTVIAPDRVVLADSEADAATMDNHLSRPEVKRALATGSGSNVRHSATLNLDMLYVARAEREAGRPFDPSTSSGPPRAKSRGGFGCAGATNSPRSPRCSTRWPGV